MLARFIEQLRNRSSEQKLAAPAPTRTPSWLTRLTRTTSLSTSEAITCVKSASSGSLLRSLKFVLCWLA
jgi:hypothetical protein